MNYISTRDSSAKSRSFSDILLEGLAPDGGLYVPEQYIDLSKRLTELRSLSYVELANEIIQLFVGNTIPSKDLKNILSKTYHKDVFGVSDVTPVTHLFDQIYVQDLSQGPSLAFKDMAMQFLGHIMDYELKRRGQSLTIVGASSGDTVSAAEEAMKGKSQINVVMLTPKVGMSPFQKAQAGSILEPNIYNISIPGPFDVCQDLVKALNRETQFKQAHNIGAVNSINWGRICAQVVYYFKGYFSVTSTSQEKVDMVVPSGNFGNILAGYVAKRMGLPIRRLIVATNENRVLDTFFKTGRYHQSEVVVTSSPSMDISKASNIERLFFDLLNRNPKLLKEKMEDFETTGNLDLTEHLTTLTNRYQFISHSTTHKDRCLTIQSVYNQTNMIIDPHTASAISSAVALRDNTRVPMICMETAKPTKFEETIQEALGFIPKRPSQFMELEKKEQRFYDVGATVALLKKFIEEQVK